MDPMRLLPGVEARAFARRVAADVEPPGLVSVHGIDLRPALEQVLFTALRAGVPATNRTAAFRRLARSSWAALGALRSGRRVAPAELLVFLLSGVHRQLFDPVEERLRADSPRIPVSAVTVGRAARDPTLTYLPAWSGQAGAASAGLLPARGARELRAAVREAGAGLGRDLAADLASAAVDAVARLRVEAVRIDACLDAARPRLAVIYDEIDAWGRLVCAAAHRRGVPVVDLPHAEAVDVEAIRGVAYDAMGVFGPRAAATLESAGVDPGRIAIVGAARFDPLVRAAAVAVDAPPRVVLAAQYPGRRMTEPVRTGILDAAVAAAGALGGSLQIVPHPVEDPSEWDRLAAIPRATSGSARVEVVRGRGLHQVLPGAALFVTGWSNSAYEAILCGVPVLTVHLLDGEPPMPFAAEGLAVEVTSAEEAALAALRLAAEPARTASLERARAGLADHLGPLDGRAAERTADLLLRTLDA
jgi:hypothetical protein